MYLILGLNTILASIQTEPANGNNLQVFMFTCAVGEARPEQFQILTEIIGLSSLEITGLN